MTSASDLRRLADRVEKEPATRDLDTEITNALFAPGCPMENDPLRMRLPKRWTGSLDAAVTLVPEGCGWQLLTPHAETCFAEVWAKADSAEGQHGGHPKSAPAALTAAALRARAAMLEDKQGGADA